MDPEEWSCVNKYRSYYLTRDTMMPCPDILTCEDYAPFPTNQDIEKMAKYQAELFNKYWKIGHKRMKELAKKGL
jgi:hypothetical protein